MFARRPYRTQERRRRLVGVVAVFGVLYILASYGATLWTDYLWFESIGFASTFRTNLLATISIGAAASLAVFVFLAINLVVTSRLGPRFALVDPGPEEEVVERLRQWAEPYGRRLWFGISAILAVLLGSGIGAQRELFLLYDRAVFFGRTDPQFGLDLGFYMFQLPVYKLAISFVTNLVVFAIMLVAAAHVIGGGIRLGGGRPAFRSGVKAHLLVLLALLSLVRGASYHFHRYDLLSSRNEGFFGAGFADVNARLPALNLLVLVAVVAAALLLWNIRTPGWTLAMVSAGAWVVVSVAAGTVYPQIIQRFRVDNDPLAREREFIQRNIDATRTAYGLDGVEVIAFDAGADLTADVIEANAPTFDNLRLWDPDVLTRSYQKAQEIRPYYRIDQVDTDRYEVEGKMTQVMVAVRELEDGNENIPLDWQNQRLIYTHGIGVVMNEASVVSGGQPEFVIKDVPPEVSIPELDIDESRLYFGETYDPARPVIVRTGTSPQEIDQPNAQGSTEYEYRGEGGVPISSLLRKLAFALRYRDLNLLISPQIRVDSRMLMHRDIGTILRDLAPFLRADSDPYPVITDGRIVWVVDLYTVSGRYPYSTPVAASDTARLRVSSGLPQGLNYVRNSVKATIDAFDGTVTLHVVDPTDPIAQTWAAVYPAMFSDGAMPTEMIEHLRFPQDLFTLQSEIYRFYHMDSVSEFFQQVDVWAITPDPSSILRAGTDLLRGDGAQKLERTLPMYLLATLPGESEASYVLSQTFNPEGKANLASVLMADSTPGRYGRLIDFRLPRNSAVPGAGQLGERINQVDEISSQFTLWRGQGSDVVLGDMLTIPVGESIIYVQPVFLAADSGGLPELRKVVVSDGTKIKWGDSLDQALALVFGESGSVAPDSEASFEKLLSQAVDAFENARQALVAGDLAGYQRFVDEAERLVDQAQALVGSRP